MGRTVIRAETADDGAAVRSVLEAAFESGLEADLTDSLRAAGGDRHAFVAVRDEKVIGHVMCTPGWLDTPWQLVEILLLAPLSVHPDHHGQGTGTALVRRALDDAAAGGVPLVFLEGSPAYYGRRGFQQAEPLGFGRPSPRIPTLAFQVAILPAHQAWMSGTVVYPDAFWRHDCVGLRGPLV